ncbi:MAG TPA: hypothetical protein VER79_05215 [Candidatus Limnocylindrales bacterium]|nr:hypothetical protein [Candidatus Limnocylindrales bacterium]
MSAFPLWKRHPGPSGPVLVQQPGDTVIGFSVVQDENRRKRPCQQRPQHPAGRGNSRRGDVPELLDGIAGAHGRLPQVPELRLQRVSG